MSTERMSPSPAGVRRPSDVRGVLLVAVLALTGVLAGMAVAGVSPNYVGRATVIVQGSSGPPDPASVYVYSEVQRYVLDRMETFATTVESDRIAGAAAVEVGEDPAAMRDHIEAVQRPTTQLIDITVAGGATPDLAVARAGAVARVAATTLTQLEQSGPDRPGLVDASVLSVDGSAVDGRARDAGLLGSAGLVIGSLLGWLVLALYRPGRWIESMRRPVGGSARTDLSAIADQSIQVEVLGVLLAGQSGKGLATVAVASFGVFGYAFTGSFWPPLIAVLVAAVASFWDLRYAAFAILVSSVSALPVDLDIVPIGPVTPSISEVAILCGLVATICRWRPDRPRGPFTGVVLAVLGVLVVGALIGLGRGADTAGVADQVRGGLTIATFFVFRAAFRGRPAHLLAVLLMNAAAASLTVLVALPLGIDRLLVQVREGGFVTGSELTELPRLLSPVIILWTPLLVIIAAGLYRLRAQWVLVVPAAIHVALSFVRSTWVVLAVVTVAVAALRGGSRAVLVRAAQAVAVAAVVLTVAGTGLAGDGSKAIADRFLSTVDGSFTSETSLSDRVNENALVIDTLKEDPVLGAGIGMPFGSVQVTYNEVQDRMNAQPSFVLHNQYLLIWVLMGIPGLLAYGALGVRLLAYTWHLWRRLGRAAVMPTAASIGILALAVQSILQTNLLDPPALITVAAMLALVELSGARPDRELTPHRYEGSVTA